MKFLIILVVDCFYIHTKTMLMNWMMLKLFLNYKILPYFHTLFTVLQTKLLIYFAIKSERTKLSKTIFEKKNRSWSIKVRETE